MGTLAYCERTVCWVANVVCTCALCISFATLREKRNPWSSGRGRKVRCVAAPELLVVLLASTNCQLSSVVAINSIHFEGARDVYVDNTEEIDILLAFKAVVVSDPWGTLSDWAVTKAGAPCCWRGVGCNSACRVTSLELEKQDLKGQVGTSPFGRLTVSVLPEPGKESVQRQNSSTTGQVQPP